MAAEPNIQFTLCSRFREPKAFSLISSIVRHKPRSSESSPALVQGSESRWALHGLRFHRGRPARRPPNNIPGRYHLPLAHAAFENRSKGIGTFLQMAV